MRIVSPDATGETDMTEPLTAEQVRQMFEAKDRVKHSRTLRSDLTPEEKERLEKYGAIEFKSAGAVRKK